MGLTKFVKRQFEPTEDQVAALNEVEQFLNSDKTVFLFKGFAGTGKTTLMKYIIKYLEDSNIKTSLMAPTGRAAKILYEKTGFKANTIHKTIYNFEELEELKKEDISYRFKFKLKNFDVSQSVIYLVDEASLISDTFSQGEFYIFGSGRLLSDLIAYARIARENTSNKVIFIGDPAQLPPVGDAISRALSVDVLKEKYQVNPATYTLSKVVRQKENSGILNVANYIRNLMFEENKRDFKLPPATQDLYYISRENVVKSFIEKYDKENVNSAIVINKSNAASYEYNIEIRKHLFPNAWEIQIGEILMIQQNNYNYNVELMNGTLVKVLEVGPLEIRSNMMSYNINKERVSVTHKFRKLKIEVEEYGKKHEVDCLVLENLLYNPEASLSYEEHIALYLDFKIRNKNLKFKTPAFKEAIKVDPYFNALRVKFGYAITCHKAQGGEWENAFVNMDLGQSALSDEYLRWIYTAITRASKNLYIFNNPSLNAFTYFKYTPFKIENELEERESTNDIKTVRLPENIIELESEFELNNAPDFIKSKFHEIIAHLKFHPEIRVKERRSSNYQEEYFFEKNGVLGAVIFNYNGKNQFTNIRKRPGSIFDSNFSEELVGIFKQAISIIQDTGDFKNEIVTEKEINKIDFSSHPKLEELYNKLLNLLKDTNIEISKVKHNDWQEIYTFKRGDEVAVIQFYYKETYYFTSASPIPTKCNSGKLLDELNEYIPKIKNI